MIKDDKRVRIITGNYGSGKTEFAVNYVKQLAGIRDKVAIADLDIVNPYYRSRERFEDFKKLGIELIGSVLTEDSMDMPALSGRILVPFIDKSFDYVVDLGGSEIGANVLGRFKGDLDSSEIDFLMVVNIYRPEMSDVEGVCHELELLEKRTGLKVTGFVNNSNLIHLTTIEDILAGDRLLQEVTARTGVSVRYTTCMMEEVGDQVDQLRDVQGELFPMHYNMRASWM